MTRGRWQVRRRGEQGFTLVELLVALALMALITAAITGGLSFGRRLWERDRTGERHIELEAAVQALGAMVATAYPVTGMGAGTGGVVGGRPRIVFEGRPDGVRFVGLSEGRGQTGGLIETVIGMGPQGGSGSGGRSRRSVGPVMVWTGVFRNRELGFQENGVGGDLHATVVVKMVTGLRFSYFLGGGGAQEGWGGDGDVGRGWVTEWRDPERLPLAVSVAIVAEGGEVATTVVLRQR